MRRLAISGLTGILLLPVLVIGAAAGLLGGGAGAGLGQHRISEVEAWLRDHYSAADAD